MCTQRFGHLFRENGRAAIVNIASIGGRVPTLGAAAYCASKAGILALTRQTALAWAVNGSRQTTCARCGVVVDPFIRQVLIAERPKSVTERDSACRAVWRQP